MFDGTVGAGEMCGGVVGQVLFVCVSRFADDAHL